MDSWTISSRTYAMPVGGGAVHSYIAVKDNTGRIEIPDRLLQDNVVFDNQSRSSWAPGINRNLLPNGTSASPKKQPPPLFTNKTTNILQRRLAKSIDPPPRRERAIVSTSAETISQWYVNGLRAITMDAPPVT